MLSILKLKMQMLKDDYKVILVMTILTLAFTFVFNMSGGESIVKVGFVDYDNSDVSIIFKDYLQKDRNISLIDTDESQIIDLIKNENLDIAIILEDGFSKSLSKDVVKIKIVKMVESMDIVNVENSIRNHLSKTISKSKATEVISSFILDNKIVDITELRESVMSSYDLSERTKKTITFSDSKIGLNSWEGYDNTIHTVVGFTIMFTMYTMIFGIADIVKERKYNTFSRLIMSPMSSLSILSGHLLGTFIVAFGQIIFIIVFGKYFFNINWGQNFAGVILISGLFIYTVTAMGLMLSGLVKTMGQLGAISPILITATSMIGGCMWPLEIVSNKFLLLLANITPQRWAILAIERLTMYQMGVEEIILPAIILLVMGTVYLTLGVIFNKRMQTA